MEIGRCQCGESLCQPLRGEGGSMGQRRGELVGVHLRPWPFLILGPTRGEVPSLSADHWMCTAPQNWGDLGLGGFVGLSAILRGTAESSRVWILLL